MKKLLQNRKNILIGGHRGCVCEHQENTIKSLEEGIRLGAEYLEIDIQLTKDNIPVVYHDVRLEDQTNLIGYVHEYTFDEIKSQIEINTLEEIFIKYSKSEIYFGLEVKTTPIDMQQFNFKLMEYTSQLISKYDMKEYVFIFGLDYKVLKYLRKIDEKIYIGLIVPFVPMNPVKLMEEMDAIIYLSYVYNMTNEAIDDLHDAGYYVSGAILRDERWMEKAVELGVDMFEADDIKLGKNIVNKIVNK